MSMPPELTSGLFATDQPPLPAKQFSAMMGFELVHVGCSGVLETICEFVDSTPETTERTA